MDDSIVVTGFGMVSSLGSDVDAVLDGMERGEIAGAMEESGGRQVPAARVRGFDAGQFISPKKVRRMDDVNCYAIGAAHMALADAGITEADKPNCGVIVGTGFAGFASVVQHQGAYLRDGMRSLTPIHFPNTVFNATAGMVAIELNLNGPNSTVVGHDVSGEFALTYAWMLLRQGMAERIVVIGADDLCPAFLEGLHDIGLPRKRHDAKATPFARAAAGMLPSEGAGALVLETPEAAARRGAKVLGRIDGIGIYSSADSVFGYGAASGAVTQSVKQAFARSQSDSSRIGWVSSAANGGAELDREEARAWSQLLSPAQHSLMPFKHFLGDFAASGVLRIGLGLRCLQRDRLPGFAAEGVIDEVAPLLSAQSRAVGSKQFLHQGVGVGGNAVSMVLSA